MIKQRAVIILAAAVMVYSCGMQAPALSQERPSSAVLIDKAWSSHGARDVENTLKFTQQVIDLYKDEADQSSVELKRFTKA